MAKLSSDKTYVTVEKGDCLWSIAATYLDKGTLWTKIADLPSNKTNRSDLTKPISQSQTTIYAGDKIYINISDTTTQDSTASNVAVVEFLGPLAGEERTLFCTWSWSKTSDLEKYLVEWTYTVEGGRTLYATQTISIDEGYEAKISKQTTWTVPENAVKVTVKVKPVAKKKTVDGKETTPWTASGWSTIDSKSTFQTKDFPPETPPQPNLEMGEDGITLTIRIDNIKLQAGVLLQALEVELVKDDDGVYKRYNLDPRSTTALHMVTVDPGARYKARCRMRNFSPTTYSEWTNYSSNVYSRPIAPTKLTAKALTENELRLDWQAAENVTGYEYQYTTNKEYFDTSSEVSSGTVPSTSTTAYLKLETGNFTYFFRVRSKGNGGESAWSNIVSLTLGKAPAAPTTWSSTTTAIVGRPVNLYWVHNSEDGSSQTYAKIELNVDGKVSTITQKNICSNCGEPMVPGSDRCPSCGTTYVDDTSSYTLDTSAYPEGAKILWRVCTAGVLTSHYGDWSVQREIQVHAQPTIDLHVAANLEGDALFALTTFPFYVTAKAGPEKQFPIGYHLTIVANEGYETVDRLGNPKIVSAGEAVYSKYFDNVFEVNGVSNTSLYVIFTPANLDLENNISYTLTCTVSMDSGLTAEDSTVFIVSWEDAVYIPNAEVGYDAETYSTIIRPHCSDIDGNLFEEVTLAVYRREYDGSFTELMTDIPNNGYTFITDPHPALDYARYRVVATDESTGAISFADLAGYPIGEPGAIIQWNEKWSTFDAVEAEPLATPNWTGSLIRLPYNIDISPTNAKDVALVEYIGREHPVSYYGTQLGESVTLKTDIPATDLETLYALRRLMIWKGDVYVRLPNGIGYWASVSVQYNQNHNDVKIPVTIDISRVEGGV